MVKRSLNSLYYADDRDIYDLIMSSVKYYSNSTLISIAKKRGILLSHEDDRQELAKRLSSMSYNWDEISELLTQTESPDRREMVTSSTHISDATLEDMQEIVKKVAASRELFQDEIYSHKFYNNGNLLRLKVTYTEPDYSKNRMIQRRMKIITMDIQRKDGDLYIRREANDRSEKIFNEIIREVKTPPKILDPHHFISLETEKNPDIRTNFFIRLMYDMDDFKLNDIVYLDVDRIHSDPRGDEHEDSEDDGEDEGIETVERIPNMKEEAKALAGIVESASLRGTNLLLASEYIGMREKGFFISHAVWKSSHEIKNGRLVEFHAGFSDGPRGSGFKFAVRGVYERNKDGTFQTTRHTPTEEIQNYYLEEIEHSAKDALANVGKIYKFSKGKAKKSPNKNKGNKK